MSLDMSQTLEQAFVIGMCSLLVMIAIGLVGFFATRWVKTLDDSVKELNNTMQSMLRAIDKLNLSVKTHDKIIAEHDETLANLNGGHTRLCPNPECPYADPEQSPARLFRNRRRPDVDDSSGSHRIE